MFSLVTVLLRPNTSSHISSFFVTEATLRCRIDDQKSSRSQHHFGHWDLNMGRWLRGLRLISSDRIHHLNQESGNEYGFPFWNITRDIPSSFSFGWPFWSCFHPNLPLIFLFMMHPFVCATNQLNPFNTYMFQLYIPYHLIPLAILFIDPFS